MKLKLANGQYKNFEALLVAHKIANSPSEIVNRIMSADIAASLTNTSNAEQRRIMYADDSLWKSYII